MSACPPVSKSSRTNSRGTRSNSRRGGNAELRSRAATVLAAASIASSFLAGQATRDGKLDALGVFAIGAYLGCVVATLYVLLPHALVLEFRGSVALELATAADADIDETLAAVTEWLEEFHDGNHSVLSRLGIGYAAGCGLLGAEILLWTASYADKVV